MNGDGRPDGLRQLVNASYQPLISVSRTRSTSARAARVEVPLGPPQRQRRTGPWSHLLSRPPAARRPRPARARLAVSASHGMPSVRGSMRRCSRPSCRTVTYQLVRTPELSGVAIGLLGARQITWISVIAGLPAAGWRTTCRSRSVRCARRRPASARRRAARSRSTARAGRR